MKPISALLLMLLARASLAQADVVTDWNETALLAIKSDRTAPPKAARALAMMHTAIYDAVNGVTQTHEPYFVSGKPADGATPEAAASVAARLVLLRLFPAQQAAFDATYNKVLRTIPSGDGKRASVDWGEHVAQTLLAERAKDGSQATVIYASRNPIGVWRPTEPAFAKPALPQWPGVKPFAMTNAAQFRPAMPPALTSVSYAEDFNQTKQLGAKNSATRTSDPGVSRSYASFSEAAAEAGMSRIYGGIHFMSANAQGLASGAELGRHVMEIFPKASDHRRVAWQTR